jgi:hypothetical protein
MFTIIKDKERITIDNPSGLTVYLANGWEVGR